MVWAADDSASREITGWFASLIEEHSGKQKRLLRNNIDFVSRMKFREIQSEEEAILTAVRLLKEGKKVFIATDHGDKAKKGKLEKRKMKEERVVKGADTRGTALTMVQGCTKHAWYQACISACRFLVEATVNVYSSYGGLRSA